MADYNFKDIEHKWQQYWDKHKTFAAEENSQKPSYYILDMFPYPSGAGLHVGHPLGYIASDIVARYHRHTGYNVLHPMGYDAFGLPAEQYAIDTGNHPAEFTDKNIDRYRDQLKMIALSYDWDREVKTSDPAFYKWTQWIFIELFNSWYNLENDRAEHIDELVNRFAHEGNQHIKAVHNHTGTFTAKEWNLFSDKERLIILLDYRLAYIGESEVNWCEALGTVLANEEVKDGLSERGGYPVVRKKMKQWFLRITAYADRLLEALNDIEWPEAIKEIQRNWIGKSVGAEVVFEVANNRPNPGPSPTGKGENSDSDSSVTGNLDTTLPKSSPLGEASPGHSGHEGELKTDNNRPNPGPSPTGKGENSDSDPSLIGNLDTTLPKSSPQGEDLGGAFNNYQTADKSSWATLKDNARELRKNQTEAEALLWSKLSDKQIGHKVRRQHVISNFIADFVILDRTLVIEIDGGIHESQKGADALRTKFLNEQGFEVIRFTNEEVMSNIDMVVNRIKEAANNRPNPGPSPTGKGESTDSDSSLIGNLDTTLPKSSPQGEDLGGAKPHIRIFTTRPDTIFGANFMVLAPEHAIVKDITSDAQREAVENYIDAASRKSERERVADVKSVTGVFTGGYAVNPFSGKHIPIWIADYVLADYGTGAIMAVPGHDSRDWAFAKTFDLPITEVVEGGNVQEASHDAKAGKLVNSDFLNGLEVPQAINRAIEEIEKKGIGHKKVNYRLRDANFSRQRYWGEPFPIVYREDIPYPVDMKDLPVVLPDVESYKPTGSGEPPLAAAEKWVNTDHGRRDTNTMPGWAGSSWYFLRYMDPDNNYEFVNPDKERYWKNVDFYIGGAEHATGHLLYSRFWHKFLFDRGLVSTPEPFKKLINQGMIQGVSHKVIVQGNTFNGITSQIIGTNHDMVFFDDIPPTHLYGDGINVIYSANWNPLLLENKDQAIQKNIPIEFIENGKLNFEKLRNWREDFKNACFVCPAGIYVPEGVEIPEGVEEYIDGQRFIRRSNSGSTDFKTLTEVEKMSKSKYNVINPDNVINEYGCDTFRMYEMFLGPIEQSKPWDTNGIDGVSRFLRKFWNLYHDNSDNFYITEDEPEPEELKVLHKCIKKVREDIERFSLNTCVSTFMIAVNELGAMKCSKRAILSDLAVLISPFAPHVAEELWVKLGNEASVCRVPYPEYNPEYLVENSFEYPISFNGKLRTKHTLPLSLSATEVEQVVRNMDLEKWTEGKDLRKVIVVHGKIVNVVV